MWLKNTHNEATMQSKNLIFRAVGEDDLQQMIDWRNDPEINYYFYDAEPLSIEQQRLWYSRYLETTNTDKIFIISDRISSVTIGMVSIYHIDWRNRKGEWGRLILDKEYRGKGLSKEIEAVVYAHAFDYLNLNKLYCEVYQFNTNVIQAHEKMGSKIEGVLRQHIYRHGIYQDVVVMSILREEYYTNVRNGMYTQFYG